MPNLARIIPLVVAVGCATTRAVTVDPPAPPRVALTPSALDAAFNVHRAELDACNSAARARDATAGGDTTLRVTVADDGRVSQVNIAQTDHSDPVVPMCLANAVRAFVFPPPAPGERTVEGTLRFARPEPPPQDFGAYLDEQMRLRRSQFAAGMDPVMPAARGELATNQTQNYAVPLERGHCYKVIGVGAPSVVDLDLKLYDSNDAVVDQDIATDAYPVVGLQRPLCPRESAQYRLEVIMYAGGGPYMVQVFGNGDAPVARPRSR